MIVFQPPPTKYDRSATVQTASFVHSLCVAVPHPILMWVLRFFYDVGTHYLTLYLSLTVNSRVLLANFTRGIYFQDQSNRVTYYSKH